MDQGSREVAQFGQAVGRGFDFRPPNVRTLADDMASKDAMMRASMFIWPWMVITWYPHDSSFSTR